MKMEQSVPKPRHIKFRRRGITQKKAYNIQNTEEVWNQEKALLFADCRSYDSGTLGIATISTSQNNTDIF
jgi:hypothetical protein